jgi:hypothetical protein
MDIHSEGVHPKRRSDEGLTYVKARFMSAV